METTKSHAIIESDSPESKNFDRDTDSEQDPDHDIEEFSSFDISDDERSKNTNESDDNREVSSGLYQTFEYENQRSNLTTATAESELVSTPKTPKSNITSDAKCIADELNSKLNDNDQDTKPSSRMSSDTFETPKTVETRASTMTSNPPFDYGKQLNYELSLPSATLVKHLKTKEMTRDVKRGNSKIVPKRLSRHTTDDISMDKDVDYSSFSIIQSMDSLFAKLSLDDSGNNHSTNLLPSSSELVELQNQLTNCKIQIKLQNDLLRDRIFQSLGDGQNKQEMSEELERKISDSLNSSKLKFKLNHVNTEYNSLKEKYDELLITLQDLNKTMKPLQDQHADLANKQHKWQNGMNSLILKIKDSRMLDSPAGITEVYDIFDTLSRYVEMILKELQKSRRTIDSLAEESTSSRAKIDELLETVASNEQEIKNEKEELIKKLESSEHTNFGYKSKIFDYENLLKSEKSNISILERRYAELQSQYDDLKNEISRKGNDVKANSTIRVRSLESQVSELETDNEKLSKKLRESTSKTNQLISMISSYHSVLLSSLMDVIDPSSSGSVLNACDELKSKPNFVEALKVIPVAHKYEFDSLNTILENYNVLLKERNSHSLHIRSISELQGEIVFLTQKINDLETMKDSETVRIHELQSQNAKLKDMVNDKVNKVDQLKKLRLEDLNKKWKAAEEALSQTKKGAQLKISELEEELTAVKSRLSQYEGS